VGWCWRRWRHAGRRCRRYRGYEQHDHDGNHDGESERGCTAEPRECCPSSHFHSGVSFSFEDQLSISCVVRRSDDPRSFLVGETAAGRCAPAYRWPFDVVAQHIDRVGIPCDGGTDDEPQYIAVRLGLAGAVHNNSKEPSCDEETGCSAVHPSHRPPRDGDIREGERLVSNESEVVDLFARLVVIPVRWLYAGLYRVGILEVSGDSHYQPGHG